MNIKNTSQSKNFIWNMAGSISSALISVVLLMIVSRFLTASDSDIYAYSYSVGNLLVVIGLFQVRNYQATDIGEKYSFSVYFLTRLLTAFFMIVTTVIFVSIMNFDAYKSQIIYFVCLYRLSDAVSDLFQGLFQQREHLDISGKSLTYRNILIFMVFTLIILGTNNLLLALKTVCLISYVFILIYDFRISRIFEKIELVGILKNGGLLEAYHLIKESFPLFFNGFLTIFNILFMPAFVMNLMMLFFRPMITEMAIDLLHEQLEHFRSLQKKLFISLLVLSALVIGGSALVGIPMLELLYGIDLHEYWITLMIIMVGGAIGSFATAIDNILTAMRYQKYLLIPYAGAFITSQLITNTLVEKMKIFGASLSFLLTMIIWLLMSFVIFNYVKKKENGKN
jgi:O-antigen/teichoic acid export membrane protein